MWTPPLAESGEYRTFLGRGLVALTLLGAMFLAWLWHYSESAERWIDLAAPHGSLRVQIAGNAAGRSRGLSRLDAIPGEGLLLKWDAPGRHPIWMMDMRFSLDLI